MARSVCSYSGSQIGFGHRSGPRKPTSSSGVRLQILAQTVASNGFMYWIR